MVKNIVIKKREVMIKILMFSIIFLNVFALTPKLTLPVFVWGLFFIFSIKKINFGIKDVIYFIFIFSMCIPLLIYQFEANSLVYIASLIILYFIFYKQMEVIYFYNSKQVLKYLYITSIVLSIYIIYEFLTKNYFPSFYIELPRKTVEIFNASFGKSFTRPRGFAEEAGHMVLFYEFSYPLVIFYLNKLKEQTIYYNITILIAIMLLNSSITFIFLIPYIILNILGNFKKLNFSKKLKNIVILSIILSIIIIFNFDILKALIEKAIVKISLNQSNNSVSDRIIRLEEVFKLVSILGIPAASIKYRLRIASGLNLYLDFFVYSGFIGGINFLMFLLKDAVCKFANKKYYVLSLFFLLFHYSIVSNFWIPYLWLLLGMISAERRRRKNENIAYNKRFKNRRS